MDDLIVLRCPGCKTLMTREHTAEGVALDRCASCAGVWLDDGELDVIAPSPTGMADTLDDLGLELARRGIEVRRCPRCNRRLVTLESRGVPGLRLDTCAHGVFVDRGELERVRALMASGDLPERVPRPDPPPRPKGTDPLRASPRDNRDESVERLLAQLASEERWNLIDR